MELWDVYNKYRHKTARSHERGNPMAGGDYHIVVHVWIINDKGQFLIQKRQSWKIGWPNMWDCSTAGSAIIGESSKAAARRETKEEIGIDLDIKKAQILFTIKFNCGFDDVWFVRQNIDIDRLKLQQEEVADAKWASQKEIKQMILKGEFIEYHYIDILFQMINSNITLQAAGVNDSEELLSMQKKVFMPLYIKYEDDETSPAKQTMDKFLRRFDIGDYYKIFCQSDLAGSVFVYEKEPGIMRLHIINILVEYQNRGITQEVMKHLELMYPEAESWELDTILSEKQNCYLYEKMGYVKNGKIQAINDKLTLVSYRKLVGINRISGI